MTRLSLLRIAQGMLARNSASSFRTSVSDGTMRHMYRLSNLSQVSFLPFVAIETESRYELCRRLVMLKKMEM
ncbi:hypothetical protein [Rhizobium sp. SAFR-030]|uniref:hypothetical protein n=1 Tax=Rhizobium sp. SAFR-030 TaxID=3387277 RepID=UPI003F80087F